MVWAERMEVTNIRQNCKTLPEALNLLFSSIGEAKIYVRFYGTATRSRTARWPSSRFYLNYFLNPHFIPYNQNLLFLIIFKNTSQ